MQPTRFRRPLLGILDPAAKVREGALQFRRRSPTKYYPHFFGRPFLLGCFCHDETTAGRRSYRWWKGKLYTMMQVFDLQQWKLVALARPAFCRSWADDSVLGLRIEKFERAVQLLTIQRFSQGIVLVAVTGFKALAIGAPQRKSDSMPLIRRLLCSHWPSSNRRACRLAIPLLHGWRTTSCKALQRLATCGSTALVLSAHPQGEST
jgi:hypothetical protein